MAVRHGRRRRTVRQDGPDPVDVHVGQRLRLARHLAGISQTELGIRLGLSFQAVQKYETGDNRISASRLYAAARIVAQPVMYFFTDIKDAPEAKAANVFSAAEIELIRCYRQLRDDPLRHSMAELARCIGAPRRRTAPSKRR